MCTSTSARRPSYVASYGRVSGAQPSASPAGLYEDQYDATAVDGSMFAGRLMAATTSEHEKLQGEYTVDDAVNV